MHLPSARSARTAHRLLALLLALSIAPFAGSGLAAQDPREQILGEEQDELSDRVLQQGGIFGTDEEITLTQDFRTVESNLDLSSIAILLLGNVLIEGRGFSLHADGVGFFCDGFDDELKPKNMHVFAEGNILLSRGDQTFRAETLFIDVDAKRLIMTESRLRIDQELIERLRQSPTDDPVRAREILFGFTPGPAFIREVGVESPIIFAAELLTIEDFERIHGEGIEFTTCEFGDPHWAIRARKGSAAERQEVEPFPGEDKPGGWLFELDDISLDTGLVTIPLLPGVVFDSRWGRYLPLRSVSYSKSGKYGTRVDTLWNGNLLLPSALTREVDLGVRLDYLSERGTGYGVDVEWGRDPLRWAGDPDGRVELFGIAKWWAIEDRGEDRNGTMAPDEDRHRTRIHQRLRLQTRTLIDFEYSEESDANFLEEFFEGESRGGKTPENVIFVRQPVTAASQVTVLMLEQPDDFRSTLERLPEMKAYWIEEPEPWAGVVLDGEASIAKLEDRPAAALALPDRDNQRGDVRLLAARPLQLVRGIRVRPFAEGRYTVWDEDLAGENEDRWAFAGGATLSSRVSRTFGVEIPSLGIYGLRHVVDFDVGYENLFYTDVDPTDLIVFDEVEQVEEHERVHLGLFQRFFTQRGGVGRQARRGFDTRSLMDARLEIDWFPDHQRDNAGVPWGPLEGEILLTPLDQFGAFVDGAVDFNLGHLDEVNAGFRVFDAHAFMLQVSSRQRRHLQDTLVLGGRWWGSEKYEFGAWTEYDLRRNDAVNQRISVVRNFHRWSVACSVVFDEGEDDDTTFRIDFGPRDLLGGRRQQ